MSQEQLLPHRPNVLFTSLGLVILDEIQFGSGETVYDVIGGSGTYATVGARLFLPFPESRSVGLIVLAGNDFPNHAEDIFSRWEISLILQKSAERKTSRARLKYRDSTFGPKSFENMTSPLQVTPDHLRDSGLLGSQSFHFLSGPQDLKPQIERLLELRDEDSLPRPLILWEPAPRSCKPENLQACIHAASLVDVFSPNHMEFAAFFDDKPFRFEQTHIEDLVSKFLSSMNNQRFSGIVVIRSGEYGCLVCTPDLKPTWISPYYNLQNSSKVIDPTGTGNAFLGAFGCAYVKTKDVVIAAQHGAVAASFVLEQTGVPDCQAIKHGLELWNGIEVQERLRSFQARERSGQ